MTVGQLIAKLQTFEPDRDVVISQIGSEWLPGIGKVREIRREDVDSGFTTIEEIVVIEPSH